MNAPLMLLDCTLRDGSYAIDYSFTARDTARICGALESAGVRMIEIGHGAGLNASGPRFGVAAAGDEEYCRAAAGVLRHAMFGAFCIAGVGRIDDIARAHDLGMGFVRIGSNVTQSEEAKPLILFARKLGLHVTYNPMKSYMLEPNDFAAVLRRVADWGVDALYVVDSAGCMLPDDVSRYVSATSSLTGVPIGFHGHNNLTLAAANCLAAYHAGATYLDATLEGIGRSGGNAHTQALVGIFDKLGVETGIDLMRVLCAGEELVRPLMRSDGVTALDVAMGMGGFHSSFLSRVDEVVARIPADRKQLIIELGKLDRQDPAVGLIEEIARYLIARQTPAIINLADVHWPPPVVAAI